MSQHNTFHPRSFTSHYHTQSLLCFHLQLQTTKWHPKLSSSLQTTRRTRARARQAPPHHLPLLGQSESHLQQHLRLPPASRRPLSLLFRLTLGVQCLHWLLNKHQQEVPRPPQPKAKAKAKAKARASRAFIFFPILQLLHHTNQPTIHTRLDSVGLLFLRLRQCVPPLVYFLLRQKIIPTANHAISMIT